MMGNLRYMLAIAIMAVILTASGALAQVPATLPAPVPLFSTDRVIAPAPAGSPPLWSVADHPIPDQHDPFLEPNTLPPPGWFINLETVFESVHLRNYLVGTVYEAGAPIGPFMVPNASFDWTASPRIEAGYRIGEGFGEFLVGYRSLATDGSATVGGGLAASDQRSRFDLNLAELSYATREYQLALGLEMRWKVGVAAATLFFDSDDTQRATDPVLGPGLQELHATNFIAGAGPHAAMEVRRRFTESGFAMECRLEGYSIWEHLQQRFTQTFMPTGDVPVQSSSSSGTTQGTGAVIAEAGLSWNPPQWNAFNAFLGYHFEYWAQVGRDAFDGSRAEFYGHGVVIQAGFTF